MTNLELKVNLSVESLGILDQLHYLAFFAQWCMDVYDIDPNEDFGINRCWQERTGKEVPDFGEYQCEATS